MNSYQYSQKIEDERSELFSLIVEIKDRLEFVVDFGDVHDLYNIIEDIEKVIDEF